MPPEGKVGVSPVCILGVNIGGGREITLRLRTDDLKGGCVGVCVCVCACVCYCGGGDKCRGPGRGGCARCAAARSTSASARPLYCLAPPTHPPRLSALRPHRGDAAARAGAQRAQRARRRLQGAEQPGMPPSLPPSWAAPRVAGVGGQRGGGGWVRGWSAGDRAPLRNPCTPPPLGCSCGKSTPSLTGTARGGAPPQVGGRAVAARTRAGGGSGLLSHPASQPPSAPSPFQVLPTRAACGTTSPARRSG